MSEPLITTKLHIPVPRSDLVPRPALEDRLDEGLKEKLTLISAPAGFGKTTLLSSSISSSGVPCGWVSLDKHDNAVTRFLTYAIAALQTTNPAIGEAILPSLQSPQPPPPLSVLPFLINDLAGAVDTILVLDDYHVIRSPEVHALLNQLLEHMPPNLHIVISSRTDPPLQISRLRGRQELIELRTSDLRFSDTEAEIFCNQTRRVELSSSDVRALNNRSEGWITGLHMAVLTLQGQKDRSSFIKSFTGSNRYILDYLLEEVLNQQTDSMRRFLMQTSILTRLSAELCDSVTGFENSQQMLEEMERTNLFLIPLDTRRKWFRYHHLFADLLLHRLQMDTPSEIQSLHKRAARWLEQNSLTGEAIEHALAGEEYDSAVRMIGNYARTMWEHADQTRLSSWLELLPESYACANPHLIAHHAFSLCFAGQFDEAVRRVDTAENCTSPDDRLLHGMTSIVRSFRSLYSDGIHDADLYSAQALELLAANQPMWRSLALSIRGDVFAFQGDIPLCENTWNAALEEARNADSQFFQLLAAAKLIVARKRLGKLHHAANTYKKQFQEAAQSGHPQVGIAGALFAVYGDILLEWNLVDKAIEHIQKGLSLCERQNYSAGIAWSSISLIHVWFAQAENGKAEKLLSELDRRIHTQKLPAWTMNWFISWKARLMIEHGCLGDAARVLKARNITPGGEISYPREVEYLALARLMMAQDDLSSAEQLLLRLQDHLQSRNWMDKLIQTELLLALLYQKQGHEQKSLAAIRPALEFAQHEGYIQTFISEGPPAAQLLYKALSAGIAPTYIGKLLSAFPTDETRMKPSRRQSVLVEPLSPRELEVLQTLCTGKTNQEIALALHIAPGTVKNHIKNIYGKLNVHNRTQAAARASDLGLIE